MSFIFLGAPFTALAPPQKKSFDPVIRKKMRSIIKEFRTQGFEIFNAHEIEKWGNVLFTPVETLKRDLSNIDSSDVAVFLLFPIYSPGVNLEIGYALARGKKMIVAADSLDHLGYLTRGLIEGCLAHLVPLTAPPADLVNLAASLIFAPKPTPHAD